MARRRGQIDEKKSEAILDAAATLFADRGLSVSMEEIARVAGVSKQTLYNRFDSKLEIARAMAIQRADAIVAPLKTTAAPAEVLEALALLLLERICHPDKVSTMRGVMLMSTDAPEIAQAVYEAGPLRSLKLLAAWLSDQTRAGRLNVPDPEDAAEMFSGLVLGHGHLRAMLNVPQIDAARRLRRAREAARLFVAAYAPPQDRAR
ncbi:TetR/AcrR family transcriptional regulator [Brevundimonas sp. SL130]|uniref:TetR/AcrR family transcriptional regulator n=1 Tax=Brevundimonas sp. SL130 TaxID=2995143 RepID=UPI00226C8CDC|nr:TetR/AcrR family transcriptional regulator [Brevundimonas sp. SL130]WAC60287.1 TetR/AcrR family transcriptional regulator [Brevundimonas sp. SL130]